MEVLNVWYFNINNVIYHKISWTHKSLNIIKLSTKIPEIWQLSPEKPARQLQTYKVKLFDTLHVAPFKHGFEKHTSVFTNPSTMRKTTSFNRRNIFFIFSPSMDWVFSFFCYDFYRRIKNLYRALFFVL